MRLAQYFSPATAAGLFAALLAVTFGCESQPCLGNACPDACNGAPCASASAANGSDSSDPSGPASGRYSACSASSDCDVSHGFSCVQGSCLYACDSHFDCAGIGLCEDVGGATYCVPQSDAPELGQYYSSCPSTTECDASAGFLCVGSGPGDLDSYCTSTCAADAECPAGFFCESVNITACENVCGAQGDPADPECVPASTIDAGGAYQCGALGPERNTCVKRRFCSECESDADCRAVPGLICARDASGEKICTQPCDPAGDSCPWGNAAVCGLWDEERGIPTCAHRFGACRGSGAPCEPCSRSSDCSTTGTCYGSTFTGERYCLDLSVECSCAGESVSGGVCTGGGCPETPGGLPMLCYVGSSSSNPGICLGASSSANPLLASPQTGCWPPR